MIKIEALEGSLIDIKAISNKILKNAKIVLSDNQIIPMDIKENEINTQFLVSNNIDFKIICIDTNDNHSIPIKYSIIKIDDLSPYIVINNPEDNFKIEQDYSIPISIEIVDDFGSKVRMICGSLKDVEDIKGLDAYQKLVKYMSDNKLPFIDFNSAIDSWPNAHTAIINLLDKSK